jgi:hypothetical protein
MVHSDSKTLHSTAAEEYPSCIANERVHKSNSEDTGGAIGFLCKFNGRKSNYFQFLSSTITTKENCIVISLQIEEKNIFIYVFIYSWFRLQ